MRSPAPLLSRSHLLWLPLICACGLFGDGDGNDGDGDGDGPEEGDWTADQADASDGWVTESNGGATGGDGGDGPGGGGGSFTDGEPTTGIEPTGADNDLPEGDQCPCVADNQDIYVLSDLGTIWSFDPTSNEFKFITEVDCGGMSDTFSMGVSRKGRAWVQYGSGDIYTVDLKDPGSACKDPGFSPGAPLFPNFGMAFVTNSSDDPCDKLYAHSGIEPGLIGDDVGALGVIDPQTLALSEIARIDYAWGELTGTGDGRLFAFQGETPPFIAEYDKTTGDMLGSWPLAGVASPSAFAFAAWGGDFYLFMTDDGDFDSMSRVLHVDFDESEGDGKAVSVIVPAAPIRIVGAGVSTCAPQ